MAESLLGFQKPDREKQERTEQDEDCVFDEDDDFEDELLDMKDLDPVQEVHV